MRKSILVVMAITVALLTACGGNANTVEPSTSEKPITSPSESSNDIVESEQPSSPSENSEASPYQSVLDEYTLKLREATPILIEEYENEAAQNTGGLEGLAELSNAKISKLAEISTEGIQKMAEIMLHTGSGKMEEYQEWAGKLQDVYMEEGKKITDAYMESAK